MAYNSIAQLKSELRKKVLGADMDGSNIWNEIAEAWRILRTKISAAPIMTATLTKSVLWTDSVAYVLPANFYSLIDIAIDDDKFNIGRLTTTFNKDKYNYEIAHINGENLLIIDNHRIDTDEDVEVRVMYNTDRIFVDDTDTDALIYKTRPTRDEDKIYTTTDDAYQLLLLESAKIIAKQVQGEDAVFQYNTISSELPGAYRQYEENHPTQKDYTTEVYAPDVTDKYGSNIYT